MARLGPEFAPIFGVTPPETEEATSPTRAVVNQLSQELDLDEGPIKRNPEGSVFDGSTYAPGGNVNPANQELRNTVGQPMIPGWEDGPRTQKVINDQGEEQSFFVNDPGTWGGQNQLGDAAARTIGGGLLEAAKGTLSFGEWLARGFSNSKSNFAGQLADALLGTDMSDDYVSWVDANFPTIAPQNDIERVGQEVTSIVAGAAGGGGLGSLMSKGKKAEQAIKTVAAAFLTEAAKKNPKNAIRATEQVVKALMIEMGPASFGATIATPNNTKPLELAGVPGPGKLVSDALPLPEQMKNDVGNFVDNATLGGLFTLAAKPAGKAAKSVWDSFFGGFASSDPTQKAVHMKQIFEKIDPDAKGLDPEEFKDRLNAFSNMIKANDTKDAGVFGELPLSPVDAAVGKKTVDGEVVTGVKEYVDTAYAFLKPNMQPEEWAAFVEKKSADIQNNLITLRQDMSGNPAVMRQQAEVNKRAAQGFAEVNTALGGAEGTKNASDALANDSLMRIDTANAMKTQAEGDVSVAEARLKAAQAGTTQSVRDIRGSDPLAATTAEDEFINGEVLPLMQRSGETSYNTYKDAFERITDGIPVNENELANKIHQLGQGKTFLQAMGAKVPSNVLAGADDVKELAKNLKGMDLKTLYNKVRPELANMLDNMEKNPVVGQNPKPIVELKNYIDQLAEESQDPSFRRAMDLYKEHQERWGNMDAFASLDTTNKRAINSGSSRIGEEQFYLDANSILEQAKNDSTGLMMDNVVQIINRVSPEDITPKLGRNMLSLAMKAVASNTKNATKVDAQTLINAIKPYERALAQTNPEGLNAWRDTVRALETAEAGLVDAQGLSAQAIEKATKMDVEARTSAAFDFVDKESGVKPTGNPEAVLKQKFNNVDATDALMTKAEAMKNPEVIDGLKAQLVKKIEEDVFTTSPQAAPGATALGSGDNYVMNTSGSKLRTILTDSTNPTNRVLARVFKDDPKFLKDMSTVLEVLELDQGGRAVQTHIGSKTAHVNERLGNVQRLINLTFGALNKTGVRAGNIFRGFDNMTIEARMQAIKDIWAASSVDSKFLTESLDDLAKGVDDAVIADRLKSLLSPLNPATPLGKGVITSTKGETEPEAFKEPINIEVRGGNNRPK
jgi:hypothetical protein